METKSKYYILDSSNEKLNFNELFNTVNPADTALFRLIIEKGIPIGNCNEFWDSLQKRKIVVSKISIEDYCSLPPDASNFSAKERREFKKLRRKFKKVANPHISEKKATKRALEFNSDYYSNLSTKMWNTNPQLISTLPCYTYQKYKLMMFYILIPPHFYKILHYEICEN